MSRSIVSRTRRPQPPAERATSTPALRRVHRDRVPAAARPHPGGRPRRPPADRRATAGPGRPGPGVLRLAHRAGAAPAAPPAAFRGAGRRPGAQARRRRGFRGPRRGAHRDRAGGGLDLGFEGGLAGGVEGGVPGGVVGGIVGGLPDAPPPPPTGPVRVGLDVQEPRKVKGVPPVYPALAAQGAHRRDRRPRVRHRPAGPRGGRQGGPGAAPPRRGRDRCGPPVGLHADLDQRRAHARDHDGEGDVPAGRLNEAPERARGARRNL